MHILFTSKVRYKRKGGGGGGRGGGGGLRGGSSGSSGSSSSPPAVPIGSGANTGGRTTARPYGNGGVPPSTIPAGQLFAGRTQGGGTRNDIYGTRTYGSGYPGIQSRGTAGLGFPFIFWPVVWGSGIGLGGAAYLHSSEYGEPNNSSRPGGELTTIPFHSSSGNTTLHIVADKATTSSLYDSVASNCSSHVDLNSNDFQQIPLDPANSSAPKPEQAVQYYRASSIVLTLDGYNNTMALNGSATLNDADAPLPGWVNTDMTNCVNQTIGEAAPLIEDGASHLHSKSLGAMGLLWLAILAAKTLL